MPDHEYQNPRLDRVEAILETLGQRQAEFAEELKDLKGVTQVLVTTQADLEAEHRRLLVAQVVMVDSVQQLAEAQRHTDERLNALIAVVDGMVRRPPPPA
jgi:division protein CdvB (Snf7/Vps24/ESCRT-III family)